MDTLALEYSSASTWVPGTNMYFVQNVLVHKYQKQSKHAQSTQIL